MTKSLLTAKKKLCDLYAEIDFHNHKYHNEKPAITDDEFDALVDEHTALLVQYPQLASLPQAHLPVGAKETRVKIPHTVPVLSLNNTNTFEGVEEFCAKVERALGVDSDNGSDLDWWVGPKIDGVHVTLTYVDRALKQGVLRGDGKEGHEVTDALRGVGGIPTLLEGESVPQEILIKGEVYIPKDRLTGINETLVVVGEERFSNPRSFVSGAIRGGNAQYCQQSGVVFMPHGYVVTCGDDISSLGEFHDLCRLWGFDLPGFCQDHPVKFNQIEKLIELYTSKRDQLSIAIDGLVIALDSKALQDRLGASRRYPNWAIAYKFRTPGKWTTVLDITENVSKTGKLTPIANIEPVEFMGVTLRRVNLHNAQWVEGRNIRATDTVCVSYHNDTTPTILSVDMMKRSTYSQAYRPPASCPACDSPVAWNKDQNSSAFCTGGITCGVQKNQHFYDALGEDGLAIKSLSSNLIDKLIADDYLNNLQDLYSLRYHAKELLSFVGTDEFVWTSIFDDIEASKTRLPHHHLYALGIYGFTKNVAEVFVESFPNPVKTILENVATPNALLAKFVEQIPPKAAYIGLGWFLHNTDLIDVALGFYEEIQNVYEPQSTNSTSTEVG